MEETNSWPFWLETAHSDSEETKLHKLNIFSVSRTSVFPRQTSLTLTRVALNSSSSVFTSKKNFPTLHSSATLQSREKWLTLLHKTLDEAVIMGQLFCRKVTERTALIPSTATPTSSCHTAGRLFFLQQLFDCSSPLYWQKTAVILRKLSWIRWNWDANSG